MVGRVQYDVINPRVFQQFRMLPYDRFAFGISQAIVSERRFSPEIECLGPVRIGKNKGVIIGIPYSEPIVRDKRAMQRVIKNAESGLGRRTRRNRWRGSGYRRSGYDGWSWHGGRICYRTRITITVIRGKAGTVFARLIQVRGGAVLLGTK
jgi:hypothetical protein